MESPKGKSPHAHSHQGYMCGPKVDRAWCDGHAPLALPLEMVSAIMIPPEFTALYPRVLWMCEAPYHKDTDRRSILAG